MQTLKQILESKDVLLNGNIIKVDNFLNQKVSISLLKEICEEFYEEFKHLKIDKIATIETGGIAPSTLLSYMFGVDLLILKKELPSFINEYYDVEVKSFTKNKVYNLCCSKNNINENENILFIDDFLANGQAVLGIKNILEQASANLIGAGFIIEKTYQGGCDIVNSLNIHSHSIVKIKEIKENKIIWG